MPFVRYRDRNILFVHIPRTGGTTVEHWLRELGPLRLFSYSLPAFSRVTPQHLRSNDIEELFGAGFFDYAFTLVRNPFERIASEYRLRCALASESVWKGTPRFSTWLENALEGYRKAAFHLDNHLRPQWEFVSEQLNVLRYEDGLAAALKQVADDIGAPAPVSLPRKLATGETGPAVRFDVADIERVLATYGADFDRFGYAKTASAPSTGPDSDGRQHIHNARKRMD